MIIQVTAKNVGMFFGTRVHTITDEKDRIRTELKLHG